jgi:hypothetical protein
MSGYYEMTVSIEGEAIFGAYADDEDEARDMARDADWSDLEIKAVNVTDVDNVRKVAGTV